MIYKFSSYTYSIFRYYCNLNIYQNARGHSVSHKDYVRKKEDKQFIANE